MQTATVRTTCPLDCPDTCGLEVTVENDRISEIRGRADHPVTQGFICGKVRRFARRVYHPSRLQHPMRGTGPKGDGVRAFEPISWDEAIAEIVTRFREIQERFGGEAVLPYHYGGSNGLLTEGFIDDLFFARLGASRLAKTICAAPSTEAALGMYARMPGVAFEDYPEAECIVVWGANPKASSIHFVPFLKEAKRRGGYIAVVDPRLNFSRNEVDLHLPVRPGTDLPLALGMIRHWNESGLLDKDFLGAHATGLPALLERADEWPLQRVADTTGVPALDIESLARVYAASSPAVIRCGWGLERNRNGGQAIAAVLAIPALMGKFGVRGGGYTMSNSGATSVDMRSVIGDVPWQARTINMTQLGEILNGGMQPPVKALFVYNCNPAVTVPDQRRVLEGLARDDLFTVVFDQVHTDTADYADIVLPATTFLEHRDIRVSYGNYTLGGVAPVIPPVGDARSNPEVFAALGRAMGFDDAPFHWDSAEYVDRVGAAVCLGEAGADAEILAAGRTEPVRFSGGHPVQFANVFPRTSDGKVHLAPPQLGAAPYTYRELDTEYPLALITPATARLISSTFGEFNGMALEVILHPSDATARSITAGNSVRVFNDLGEVHCRARLSASIRPGVVSMPKGAWRSWSANGLSPTALCPAHVNDVGGGACFNDARVEIERT